MRNSTIHMVMYTFVLGLIFVLAVGGFKVWEYFYPKSVEVQNTAFHNSQAYQDGTIKDLAKDKMEYDKAEEPRKSALKSYIISTYSSFPEEKLPTDLRDFLKGLRN